MRRCARAELETQYFGLRVFATAHDDWTTAQIIEAYRGQAHAERAFHDLKDPWVGAFRPQYHSTDQKLVVHALLAVLGLLLGPVLLRRARQRAGFTGSFRRLIQTLGQIRGCVPSCTTTTGPTVRGSLRMWTPLMRRSVPWPRLSALGRRRIVPSVHIRRAVTELPRTHALAEDSRFPRGKITLARSAAPSA